MTIRKDGKSHILERRSLSVVKLKEIRIARFCHRHDLLGLELGVISSVDAGLNFLIRKILKERLDDLERYFLIRLADHLIDLKRQNRNLAGHVKPLVFRDPRDYCLS